VTYRVNGTATKLTGLYALPHVEIGPGDLARAAAGPVVLLSIRLPDGPARLVLRAEAGRPTLTLEGVAP
jgi:hypothetical protein